MWTKISNTRWQWLGPDGQAEALVQRRFRGSRQNRYEVTIRERGTVVFYRFRKLADAQEYVATKMVLRALS